MINFGEYSVPLLVGSRTSLANIRVERYAGVGFFVNGGHRLCTCKHIAQAIGENEVLLAKNLIDGRIGIVHALATHPRYDFATGIFSEHAAPKSFTFPQREIQLGEDVQALGFTNEGRSGENVQVSARLFKGHTVRVASNSSIPGSRSILEISFPSHKGFSGAPLISTSRLELVGMLFSNMESTIELYSYSEVTDSSAKFSRKLPCQADS